MYIIDFPQKIAQHLRNFSSLISSIIYCLFVFSLTNTLWVLGGLCVHCLYLIALYLIVGNLYLNWIPVALQTCSACLFPCIWLRTITPTLFSPTMRNWKYHYHLCWLSCEGLMVEYTFPPLPFSTFLWLSALFPKCLL